MVLISATLDLVCSKLGGSDGGFKVEVMRYG